MTLFKPPMSVKPANAFMSHSPNDRSIPARFGKRVEDLGIDSTLQELQLIEFSLDVSTPGKVLSQAFENSSELPGVILLDHGQFVGMISRRQFLERMSRPYGVELFTRRSIQCLYDFIQAEPLICSGDMLILAAALKSLERSPESLYEPIVVEVAPQVYRLLGAYQLIVAQSCIHQYTANLLGKRTRQLDRANAEITHLNHRLQAENLRLSAELEVARQLQTRLLPKPEEFSQIPGLEIAGFMEPAAEVGGDYYDVLTHHNGRALIAIGDVTGHGIDSGILMLMVQTAVRTLLEHDETDPTQFLTVLNRTIYKNVQRMNCDKNLSLCILEYEDGRVYVSGQHEEILWIRNGRIERLNTLDLGFPIGLEPHIEGWIDRLTIQLNPGDSLVLFTDGIPEAENAEKQLYGIDRLCHTIEQNWQSNPSEMILAIVADWRQYVDRHPVDDDITLVVLKQMGNG
jgi:serine phosphatase RsbU (regulator of sigma subunit)